MKTNNSSIYANLVGIQSALSAYLVRILLQYSFLLMKTSNSSFCANLVHIQSAFSAYSGSVHICTCLVRILFVRIFTYLVPKMCVRLVRNLRIHTYLLFSAHLLRILRQYTFACVQCVFYQYAFLPIQYLVPKYAFDQYVNLQFYLVRNQLVRTRTYLVRHFDQSVQCAFNKCVFCPPSSVRGILVHICTCLLRILLVRIFTYLVRKYMTLQKSFAVLHSTFWLLTLEFFKPFILVI